MSMDSPSWSQGAEPPPAKKSGSKVWLILGVSLGLCVVLCCGGFIAVSTYFGAQFAGMMSDKPEEIRASTAEIASIDIPPEVPPAFRMNLNVVGQDIALVVYYGGAGSDNKIWLARAGNALRQQSGGNPDQLRGLLENQMNAPAGAPQVGTFKTLSDTSQREVEITVNGQAATISVIEGTDSAGKKFTQATGMFESKSGPAIIKLQLDSETYPPEKIDAILQSIK